MKTPRNPTNTPRGGWNFIDPLTQMPVSENHHTAFLQKVRIARIANGIEMHGGWEHEVMDEVCRQNPGMDCIDTEVPESPLTADDVHRFITTLLEQRGNDLVSDEEHRRRADICAVCPLLGVVNCKSCGWLARKLTELIGGRRIHQAEAIYKKGCKACKCDLSAKTYFPLDVLRRVDERMGTSPVYDKGCWMLETPVP